MRRVAVILVAVLLIAGCARVRTPSAQPAGEPITVMAAASLKDAFEAMAVDFAAERPATTVTFNFAGSQQLAQQLAEGSPGDVFATAHNKQMDDAVQAGRVAVDAPAIFARNRLVVVVPADNPAGIARMKDLARPCVKLVLATAAVPAGQYALAFLANAAATAEYTAAFSPTVLSNVVSYETNVRSVLTKVALGEADAGIVYASDAPPGSTQVATLAIPEELNVLAEYPIAVIQESAQPAAAQAFVDYVHSEAGQATLERFGFLRADAGAQGNQRVINDN